MSIVDDKYGEYVKFKPIVKKENGIALFAVDLYECGFCGKNLVAPYKDNANIFDIFPTWKELHFEAQAKRAGLGIMKTQFESHIHEICFICEDCYSEGKLKVTCCVCGEEKSSDRIKESVGYCDAKYFCIDCYENKPYKEYYTQLELEKKNDHSEY